MILRIFIGRGVCLVLFCFVVLLVWCLLFVFFGLLCFSSENSAFNSRFILFEFPVVDRQCLVLLLVLDRQCRKKKTLEYPPLRKCGPSNSAWEEMFLKTVPPKVIHPERRATARTTETLLQQPAKKNTSPCKKHRTGEAHRQTVHPWALLPLVINFSLF